MKKIKPENFILSAAILFISTHAAAEGQSAAVFLAAPFFFVEVFLLPIALIYITVRLAVSLFSKKSKLKKEELIVVAAIFSIVIIFELVIKPWLLRNG